MEHHESLSPHFTLGELIVSETAMRKGMDNTPSPGVLVNLRRLANTLEQVRAAVGNRPVVVSSGFRSHLVNKMIGGSDRSAHVSGLAADFTVPGMRVVDVAQAIIVADVAFDQLIYEGNWVHLGLREGNQRREVLTAVFTPGRPTRYVAGLA